MTCEDTPRSTMLSHRKLVIHCASSLSSLCYCYRRSLRVALTWKRLIAPKGCEIWRVCKNVQNFPSLTWRKKNRFFLRIHVINVSDSQWTWKDLLCLLAGRGNYIHPISSLKISVLFVCLFLFFLSFLIFPFNPWYWFVLIWFKAHVRGKLWLLMDWNISLFLLIRLFTHSEARENRLD